MKPLVTGGGGFLGPAIVQRLRERGDDVRPHQGRTYPDLEPATMAALGGRALWTWGRGAPPLRPRLIKRAKAGRLRLVGDGRNLVDSTYIDNAAAAHLLAADHLTPGAPCAGRVYFVTNGEPLPIGE